MPFATAAEHVATSCEPVYFDTDETTGCGRADADARALVQRSGPIYYDLEVKDCDTDEAENEIANEVAEIQRWALSHAQDTTIIVNDTVRKH